MWQQHLCKHFYQIYAPKLSATRPTTNNSAVAFAINDVDLQAITYPLQERSSRPLSSHCGMRSGGEYGGPST